VYCSSCGKIITDDAAYCQYCGARVARGPFIGVPAGHRPFARYSTDKKIAGVCGGVARYFDLDPSLVRAIWLLTALLTGVGLLVYPILWIAMPLDPVASPAPPATTS
jgi:phage shock protein C